MNLSIKYGIVNAITGGLFGTYVTLTATGDGYEMFIVFASITGFIVGSMVWRWMVGSQMSNSRLIIAGLITGVVAHYVFYMVGSIWMNLCYWLTGNCTGSLGDPPATILSTLVDGFALSLMSLILIGWLSIPVSIGNGFIVKYFFSKQVPLNE